MKLGLALTVELEAADGQTVRLHPDGPADRRPLSQSFRGQRGDGFAESQTVLAVAIDREVDARLLDTIRYIGADGSIAYEGRVVSKPRSLSGDGQTIVIEAVGWMSHTRDRPFTFIYRDCDLSRWQGPPLARRSEILDSGRMVVDPATSDDPASPGLALALNGPWANGQAAEAWYDAGPNLRVANFARRRTSESEAASQPSASFEFYDAVSDDGENVSASGDYHDAIADGETVSWGGAAGRYAAFIWRHASVNATAAQYSSILQDIHVEGEHSLTDYGDGFAVSDMIRDLCARFAPKLDTSGVAQTTYPVSQAAWHEPAHVFDAIADLNGFHLWNLGVFENRRLDFSAPDLTKADWQVRFGDPGVDLNLAGDSVDQLANGVVLTYTDLTSQRAEVLYPSDHDELRDDDPDNPANTHGLSMWTTLALPFPTVLSDALQLGRAYLAEFNRPKSPGSISIRSGYIRDSAGIWQPGWRVRPGQTIATTNLPNDAPRMIAATSWSGDSRTLEISLDAPPKRVEAVIGRQQARRASRGLS